MQTYAELSPSPFLWGRFQITQGFQKEGAEKSPSPSLPSASTNMPLVMFCYVQNSDGSSLDTYKIKYKDKNKTRAKISL